MIKTKSVYDPVDLESDGFRILIMRKWPREIGYKKYSIHKWSKELGPSRQLLDKWDRSEIAWGGLCDAIFCRTALECCGQNRNRVYSKNVYTPNYHLAVQGARKRSALSPTRPDKYCKWSC